MIFTREQLEDRELALLAPYGMKSGDTRGRVWPDDEHPYRSAYQKDRDRVIKVPIRGIKEYRFVYGDNAPGVGQGDKPCSVPLLFEIVLDRLPLC